ncbi:hypothetical protein [Streptomyces sp. NPDC058613]
MTDIPDEVRWWRAATWREELYETWFYETFNPNVTVEAWRHFSHA